MLYKFNKISPICLALISQNMIHTFPTVHFYPSHLRTGLHVHASTISTTSSNLTVLRTAASHNYGTSTVPRNSNRLLLRSNNPAGVASAVELESASNVVRKFYDGINRRDLASVEDLIAINCIYEDLVFPRPFVGRKAILEFFKQFIDSISTDLQFAIDDISEEDTSAVGVTWHLDWKGKPFPFSKGCSFYRLDVINGQKQIVYGRDCVEPAIKPGETAFVCITYLRLRLSFLLSIHMFLHYNMTTPCPYGNSHKLSSLECPQVAIRGVTWLLQKFPFLADRL